MQFNPKVSFRFVSIRPSPTTLRRFNLGGISQFRILMDSVGRITEMAQKEDEKQEERTMRANILFIGRYEEISSIFISSPRSFDFYLQKKEKEKSRVSRGKKKDSSESSYEKAGVRETEKLDAKFGDKYFFPKDEDTRTKFARGFEFY